MTTARTSVIEVNVPQRAVGAVIGRQGSRIKEVSGKIECLVFSFLKIAFMEL